MKIRILTAENMNLMEKELKSKPINTAEYVVGIGYVLFICLAFALCAAVYYFTYFQPKPSPVNTFATGLPSTTSTPHFLPTHQQVSTKIIVDNFSSDKYGWEDKSGASQTSIEDGKMFLESLVENTIAIADCQIKLCAVANEPYFLEADLSTDVATDQGFGIILNHNETRNTFFLFEINTEAKKYSLYHHEHFNGWSLRVGGESNLIRSFPAVNTLGIYIDGNSLELYINGEIVESYMESGQSFQNGHYGFLSENSGFKLIVDNLTISR